MSNPIKFLPFLIAASAVVPLPINGSNTVSPSLELAFNKYSNSFNGFSVGCLLLRPLGNLHTLFL